MIASLNEDQRDRLGPSLKSFISYLETEDFQQDQEERKKRVSFFQNELPAKLEGLSEADVAQLISELWASQMWGNKQYLVQTVISDNGIDKLREELKQLVNRNMPTGRRYERWLKEVKRLGPASVTEMLCYLEPDRCGIWNQKARQALRILGLDTLIDPGKYKLSGDEYEVFNRVLEAIAKEMTTSKIEDVDLLLVDFLLYQVSQGTAKTPQVTVAEFDHDEIRDLVESIGVGLGFDASKEVAIAHGAVLDVVWRARIANLGMVTYAFEVHKSGSIDSLVLNLQKARSTPTVQKVIAVSDEGQLQTIKREVVGLPEEFCRALSFWPVSEVQKAADNLQVVNDIVGRLGLVPGTA